MNLSKKILAGAALLIALGLGAISGLGGPALWEWDSGGACGPCRV